MKGRIVLIPVSSPKEGMKVVYGNEVNPDRLGIYNGIVNIPDSMYPNHPMNGMHNVIDSETNYPTLMPWELSDLKQIAVEYKDFGINPKNGKPFNEGIYDTVILPIHPEDWNTGMALIGHEVEFEQVDGEMWTDAPYGAKLLLPTPVRTIEDIPKGMSNATGCWKPVEETWDDIHKEYASFANKIIENGGKPKDIPFFQNWLKQHYHTPKRK